MIKALLFDWGGVMSNGGRGGELAARLAANLGIPLEQANGYIESVWEDYSQGAIDEPALWTRIEKAYGASISYEQRKIWNTWEHTALLPEMGELVGRLRRQGYGVGLVSNTIPNTATEIRKHGGYALFDFAILSYEVGVAKPDTRIYELAMENLPGLQPSEVVFVDDQERCLVPAQSLGMTTVHAVSVPQVIADVTAICTVVTS